MSVEPFKTLVKLAGRAFYDDILLKNPKKGKTNNRGIAVVALDALTRRQWVREEDLAKDLKLNPKQLRQTLQFFEEEKLVTRYHRKETTKIVTNASATTGDGEKIRGQGEEKKQIQTYSYCCLDYAHILDVLRYRLHHMKKKLKDELENKGTVQEYEYSSCKKRYTDFDAMHLISPEDGSFCCETCLAELVVSENSGGGGKGDVDKKRRQEMSRDLLWKIEVQLKPLMNQINRVKDLPVPEFGSLQAWEQAYVGETKVEVNLCGVTVEEGDTDMDSSDHFEDRRIGMKSKRDQHEADQAGSSEEDEIDWEDG